MAFVELVRSLLPPQQFKSLFRVSLAVAVVLGMAAIGGLTVTGKIAPWTGRLYSLWDTSYASKHIPIIASVSEHQPTAWTSFFFDLQWMVFLLPAGLYLCFKELRDEHVFVILYAVTGSYFASVMVRLMLTLTPCACVAGAIALSTLFDVYVRNNGNSGTHSNASSPVESGTSKKSPPIVKRKSSASRALGRILEVDTRLTVLAVFFGLCGLFVVHSTWVTSSAYSSPSVVLASTNADGSQYIIDDFREAYYWLRQNTPKDTKVMSWWDYGYQLAVGLKWGLTSLSLDSIKLMHCIQGHGRSHHVG